MIGAKIFSSLNASCAFWQIDLTDKSSDDTIFNTPFGRYKFLRMLYGISSVPEVFQGCFNDIFGDLERVTVYINDIVVWENDAKNTKKDWRELSKERLKAMWNSVLKSASSRKAT